MTVDTGGEWLTVLSLCTTIRLAQDGQGSLGGTVPNWTIQAPNDTSAALTMPPGAAIVFQQARYVPGEQVAFLKASTGSVTFTWVEQ